MTISIQTANRVPVLVVLALLGLAGRAQAMCIEGATQQCTVNGQPGTRECVNGEWTSCLTDEPTGPPSLAAPSLPSRTSTTITVNWSGSLQAGEQYQLQYYAGAWVGLATVGSPAVYVHSGLQPDRKYCYRIQATGGEHGTRSSPSNCKYTTDGTGRKAWRIQLEFHTANVGDAGTDDGISVSLTEVGGNLTWIDYGRDDFERGDTFQYASTSARSAS